MYGPMKKLKKSFSRAFPTYLEVKICKLQHKILLKIS